MNNKNGFTLIEVILALVLSAIISAYVFKTISQNSFNKSIIKLQEKIHFIVNDGVISNLGYVSGVGEINPDHIDHNDKDDRKYCSPNLDFTGLSTERLSKCMAWNQRNDGNEIIGDFGLDENAPPRLFSTDLMQGGVTTITDTVNGKTVVIDATYGLNQCKFEVEVATTGTTPVTNQFNLFVDCSRLEITPRELSRVEEAISFEMERGLSNIFLEIKEDAINLDGDTIHLGDKGDTTDGKVWASYGI